MTARNAFVPVLASQIKEKDSAKERVSSGPVFSHEPISFEWMKKVDLDLDVNIKSFDPELSHAESARASIAMSSGQLWVKPVSIKYPVGQLTVELRLDARSVPQIHLTAFGNDLDPWRKSACSECGDAECHNGQVL